MNDLEQYSKRWRKSEIYKNLLYVHSRRASSKNHRVDNAGVLYSSNLGNFTVGNDAVPCNLSGDFCSVHMQSQWACGLPRIGHYTKPTINTKLFEAVST